MEWLWSRWPDVEEKIERSEHTLLLLDYDGTLAPIAPSPKLATLSPATRSVLRSLSQSSKVTVVVISGRSLLELRRLVGLPHLIYVGNHGLEMWREGRRVAVAVQKASREAIRLIRPRLAKLAAAVPGASLEYKGLSVSLHYRLVPGDRVARLKAAFRREVLPLVRPPALTVLNGKKVIEIRPGLNWTKGHAVMRLMKRLGRPSLLPIYIGDDRTDEDAFGALTEGLTIRVGAHRRSKARYYVRGVREVLQFLEWIRARYA
jgi:trehalose 6-phosphate phosphatase